MSNFSSEDTLLVYGRVGLACTLFFSIPILTLPCREVTVELVDKCRRFIKKRRQGRPLPTTTTTEKAPLLAAEAGEGGPSGLSSEDAGIDLKMVVVTLMILGGAYYFAVSVPGVSLVWALCGSSLGIFLGFTLPTTFYLKVPPLPFCLFLPPKVLPFFNNHSSTHFFLVWWCILSSSGA